MLAIGVITAFLVVGALSLDEGEVVTLLTKESGREYQTHLWIIEIDDREFLRANRPDSRWLARLEADPAVGVRRSRASHGPVEHYWARVIDDAELRFRVDDEIAKKYSYADRVRGRFVDREKSRLVELTPRSAPVPDAGGELGDSGAGS